MKQNKLNYFILSMLFFTGLFSCTDSTTDDATVDNSGQDTVFTSIENSLFTGVYDTLDYTFLVNTISQKEYESVVSENRNEDSLRKVVCGDKEGGCMEAMESFAIAKYADKVKRNGNDLILKLSLGNSITLANMPNEDDSYEVYQFLTTDINGYYIIAVYYMESYDYILVNSVNGKITHSIGSPLSSPDKKQYIAGNYDMIAAFTFNGIELFSKGEDSVESNARIDFLTWGPDELKWKNDSTVYIKQKFQFGEAPKEENNFAAMRIRKRKDRI